MKKSPRITIKDIARECGVSLSTVSLVINNNPRISEKTRLNVQDVVRRHGYRPNQQARGLASKSSRMISVVAPDLKHVFSDVYFGEIISGIHAAANEAGYKIMLDVADARFVRNREYLGLIESRRADGMLFLAAAKDQDYLREMDTGDPLPFLLVNHYVPDTQLNFVAMDYVETAQMAMTHLHELGHQHIGLLAGTHLQSAQDFLNTCLQHGQAAPPLAWVDAGNVWNQQAGFDAAAQLLDRHPEVTAVIAANDRLAIGAMRQISGRGLDVPGDVSVLGVGYSSSAPFTAPGLTMVQHDLYQLGRIAFENVLALFKKEITDYRRILPVALEKRDSTGPLRRNG